MKVKLGFKVISEGPNRVGLRRETNESIITLLLGSKRGKSSVETPLKYFNRMVASIAKEMGYAVKLKYRPKNRRIQSTHVITEDTGIVFGEALKRMLEQRMSTGVRQRGSNVGGKKGRLPGVIVGVSVEGRSRFQIIAPTHGDDVHEIIRWPVEDSNPEELRALLSGMAAGLGASITIIPLSGSDPHHIWESVFRGLGCALKHSVTGRKTRTSGVSGLSADVLVETGSRRNYRLATGSHFINHMLEHIGWNSGFNLDVKSWGSAWDLGVALGCALKNAGAGGAGIDLGVIDEAAAVVSIRPDRRLEFTVETVEGSLLPRQILAGKQGDTKRVDLDDFYGAVAGSLGAAVNICLLKTAKEKAWDEIASGFGSALKEAFSPAPYLAGTTTGVKGTIE